jgi:hypothetical protein
MLFSDFIERVACLYDMQNPPALHLVVIPSKKMIHILSYLICFFL